MIIALPRLVKEKPCAPRAPTIMASISGSVINPLADHSTMKFAPVPPRVFSAGTKASTGPKRTDRDGLWQVTVDEVARRVEVVNAQDVQWPFLGGVVDTQRGGTVHLALATPQPDGRIGGNVYGAPYRHPIGRSLHQ